MHPPQLQWPQGQQAAISLTFDDGMASQLELAIPLLNRHNLPGVFYVNPRDDYAQSLLPWREAAAAGHEVGNHTVSHPCSKNFTFISENNRPALEEMSLAAMEAEILLAGSRLQEIIPDQGPVSFCYPCYQPFVGKGLTRQSYVPLVAKHCLGGRGRGERHNDPRYCDVAYLWSFPCERMAAPELIGLAEQALAQRQWAIFTFHGVNAGGLAVAEGDLAELCAYLDRKREEIWTATVAQGAAVVTAFQRSLT